MEAKTIARWGWWPLLAVAVLWLLLAGWPAGVARAAWVADGDTLEWQGARWRLYGIDAPELHQDCRQGTAVTACGRESKAALQALLKGRELRCRELERDQYGRIVGVCRVRRADGAWVEVNRWMVMQGCAVAYRAYSKDYVREEEAAKAAKRGVWAGAFEVPSAWRRAHPR